MRARYANLRNYQRVMQSYRLLADHFGHEEFTSKDYQNAKPKLSNNRRAYSTLAWLADSGIIKIVRTVKETKTQKLEAWERRTYLVNKDGNRIMTDMEWFRLSPETQKRLIAMNGQDFRMETPDTEDQTHEKYIYVINEEGLNRWRHDYGVLLEERANDLAVKMAILSAKRDSFLTAAGEGRAHA